MADIIPFLGGTAVFDPETTDAMSAAFDEVCRVLKVNGNARTREVIATRIIELARRGERDPAQLRDRILREAGAGDFTV
jgi:hypothetical protein